MPSSSTVNHSNWMEWLECDDRANYGEDFLYVRKVAPEWYPIKTSNEFQKLFLAWIWKFINGIEEIFWPFQADTFHIYRWNQWMVINNNGRQRALMWRTLNAQHKLITTFTNDGGWKKVLHYSTLQLSKLTIDIVTSAVKRAKTQFTFLMTHIFVIDLVCWIFLEQTWLHRSMSQEVKQEAHQSHRRT